MKKTFLFLMIMAGSICASAHGQALVLARVAKLECDMGAHPHCRNDMTAIYHVGVNQAGINWAPYIWRYSKIGLRVHQRARFIRTLTPISILRTPAEQRAWHWSLWHARRVISGAVPNPAPGAKHWGGRMDDPRSSLVPIVSNPPTRNTFYKIRR